MKKYDTIKIEQEGSVVTVILNRPDFKNSINMQMVNDLADLMDSIEDEDSISVLIIKGSDGNFSTGIDLHDFVPDKSPTIYGLQKWEKMCRRLERLNKFTIAAIEGDCIGGGFQLALTCDLRIAVKKSKFSLNEVKLGFLPGMATFRLSKYIGLGRAKNLILTGRIIDADEAQNIGILDTICSQLEFEDVIKSTTDNILSFHPTALELGRRLIHESYSKTYEEFIGSFLAAQYRVINTDVFKKLIIEADNRADIEDEADVVAGVGV